MGEGEGGEDQRWGRADHMAGSDGGGGSEEEGSESEKEGLMDEGEEEGGWDMPDVKFAYDEKEKCLLIQMEEGEEPRRITFDLTSETTKADLKALAKAAGE